MWNIRKIVKKGEYLYAVVPEHPKATINNYVLHHRVVMENHLGRLLEKGEIVHHKDHNKHNNSIANLEVMNSVEHNRLHSSTGRATVTLTCPTCGKEFIKFANLLKPGIQSKCSRKCNGKASRKKQLSINNNGHKYSDGYVYYQMLLNGDVIGMWEFSSDLNKSGFERKSVVKCCSGICKTHKGFLWSRQPKENQNELQNQKPQAA